MGEEDERETCFGALKLPFLHTMTMTMTMDSPDHPLQTSASVPFKWEDRPGKPRPCSDIILIRPEPARTLELPPCKFTRTPSPNTVLDGPYNVARPKFSSFRFFSQDTFNNSLSSVSPEGSGGKSRGLFGKFKKEFDGGSCRFSPSSSSISSEAENVGVKLKRNGSFSTSHAKSSHLWTSIYQGIKQAIQWKSSKKKKKSNKGSTCVKNGI